MALGAGMRNAYCEITIKLTTGPTMLRRPTLRGTRWSDAKTVGGKNYDPWLQRCSSCLSRSVDRPGRRRNLLAARRPIAQQRII